MGKYDSLRQAVSGTTNDSEEKKKSKYDNLRMSMGLIPDTRPKEQPRSLQVASPEDAAAHKQYADARKASYQSSLSAPEPPDSKSELPGRDLPVIGAGLRMLDKLAENPISKAVAEYTVPDAPMIDPNGGVFSGATLPGTNARQQFLDRSGQEAATGVPKFIGQAAAPFFVPGAQLGSGTALSQGAESLLAKAAPQLSGIGRAAAREGLAGGVVGFGSEYAQGTGDLGQAAVSGAFGAVGGAALGGAAAGIGRGLDKVADKYAGTRIGDYLGRYFGSRPEPTAFDEQIGEMLALPSPRVESRLAAARERSSAGSAFDEPIAPYGESPTYALPQGNYIQPQRLRVESNPTNLLDRVMTQIKPEVEQLIAVPQRRDLLIDYIQKHTEIPREEIWNMPQQDLQELGQYVREGINLPKIATETAAKYGHDLPALLNREAPTVSKKLASDAQKRAYGVYPESLPKLRQPEGFNISARGQVDAPVTRAGFLQGKQPGITRRQPVRQAEAAAPAPQSQPVIGRITPEARPAQAAPAPSPAAKPGMQERGLSQTLRASEKTPQGFKDGLQTMYRQTPNEETLAAANKRLNKDVEEATSYVLGNSRFTAEKSATALRLIDHYNSTGNIQRAVDIAEKVSEEATRAGQAIQALSMFNRLSPEGVLVYAQRLARKTNEKIPVGAKEVKVTDDMAASITGLARASQRMTGVKDLANDVMTILEKAKTGDALTDAETAALKRFVEESKQFVKETSRKPKPPRPPQQPKDKRVRDNVVSFLDAQEQAAKERLRARGIQVSSTPLDVWADYAVIGAAKMAKGVVKFSDWSEQMVKELGEDIRPHLDKLYDRAKEAFEASTKKVTKETISEAEKLTEKVIRSKQLDQNAADSLRTLAKKVSDLSGDAKQTASQDLQAVLQALDKPSLLKKVSSAQTIGQLLNPKTQVRNALGNELFYRIERLNKLVATPIDIARSKITGGERTVTFRTNNQGEYWRNWMRGAKAGWKGVNVNGLETQYDLSSPAFKSKYNPLTYMEKALGAALKSFDTAAYMRAYNNTLGELATLRAVNEGKGGDKELIQQYIREADDNMMRIADEYGRYVTLQDSNMISNGLVALKKGLNFKQDWGLGDLILKYPKTPGNILMRALEYSPAGIARSMMILYGPFKKAEPNTAEVTQALTRAIVGSLGFTGMGYFLMDAGVLTGSASKDRDIRDLQKSAGQGQYQVNLSALGRLVMSGFDTSAAKLQQGDLLYTYDWMQPVSMAVSIGANVNKNMTSGKQKLEGALGAAYNSFEGGLSTLTEQSVLSGLKSAVEGYPGQTVTDKIMDILSDTPASFVPTAFNQAKQLTDNSKPETYSPDKLTQSLNKAQAKIPGLAGKLPKQYDTLGREKEAYQDNSVFNVLFNPGFASRYELSPEAQLVVDLITETGDETVAPRVPGKTVTIEDPNDKSKTINIKLTGEQYSRYQQLQGEETRKEIGRRFKTEGSEKSRLERMDSILRNAGDRAKKQLKKELK